MSALYWHGPGPGLIPVVTWRPEQKHCSVVGYASPATTPTGILVMFSFGDWCECRRVEEQFVILIKEQDNDQA